MRARFSSCTTAWWKAAAGGGCTAAAGRRRDWSGEVNQHGQVQPVGGVTGKTEGFFDFCRLMRRHLMPRDDVVDAGANGQFHIWLGDEVDDALRLLTGMPAGEPDAAGVYPEGTLPSAVAGRLAQYGKTYRDSSRLGGSNRPPRWIGSGAHRPACARENGRRSRDGSHHLTRKGQPVRFRLLGRGRGRLLAGRKPEREEASGWPYHAGTFGRAPVAVRNRSGQPRAPELQCRAG